MTLWGSIVSWRRSMVLHVFPRRMEYFRPSSLMLYQPALPPAYELLSCFVRGGSALHRFTCISFQAVVVIAVICETLQPAVSAAPAVRPRKTLGDCFMDCFRKMLRCTDECSLAKTLSVNYIYHICKKRLDDCKQECVKRFRPADKMERG